MSEMITKQLYQYLKGFLMQNNWSDDYTQYQALSIYTTLCLVGRIDFDNPLATTLLEKLHSELNMEEIDGVSFDDFHDYMFSYIA